MTDLGLREKLLDEGKSNIENWNVVNEKLEEIKKLEEEVGRLLGSISCDVIDDWYQELRPDWERYGLTHEERKSLGINIQGVWVGCWGRGKSEPKPFWGFYSENEFTEEQHAMIKDILEKVGITDYVEEKNNRWKYWQYTTHGAKRCNDFYNAAIELGYLIVQNKQ